MKKTVLLIAGLSFFLAGCHPQTTTPSPKTAGIAEPPPAPPVAIAKPPAPAPQPPPQNTAKAAPPTVASPPTAPPAAAPAKRLSPVQRADLNGLLEKLADAFFDYDQATIRPDANITLTDNVKVIRDILVDYPAEKLLIEGHADERGSSEYNLALAERRGKAAEEFLSSRGIPQTQLSVLSLGKERPVCTDQTEACYQRNRRIHITVAP